MASLRERNRRNAMRESQRHALKLFQKHGFDAVTVDQIAGDLDMAASTLYRHFGTKENLVLWDEHDPAIDAAFERQLGSQPPLAAMRDALIESLAELYTADLEFQLERVGYIYSTTQLHAAAVEADFQDREDLTVAMRSILPRKKRSAAPILAGAALLALDVALERWQSGSGRPSLAKCIADAFDTVSHLGDIG